MSVSLSHGSQERNFKFAPEPYHTIENYVKSIFIEYFLKYVNIIKTVTDYTFNLLFWFLDAVVFMRSHGYSRRQQLECTFSKQKQIIRHINKYYFYCDEIYLG